jgi:LEA14-like dessication related protein
MKRKLSIMAAILICGLVCTTCDLLKDVVKAPEVSLKSVDFTNIDFEGLTLLSKLDIQNDNSITIPLPKIDWDLNIIDNPFVEGIIQSKGALKSRGATEVQFPVNFTYVDLWNTITALTDENAKYKLNMKVHIPVPELGDMSWPLAHEGKVPLMREPYINVATPPKGSLSGLTGKIDFALNMKNNSNIDVIINDFSCVLKIGNTSLSKGGVISKPTIQAGGTGIIPFTFSLTAADIAAIGSSVITGSISNYTITGNYKFGFPEFPFLNELGDTIDIKK